MILCESSSAIVAVLNQHKTQERTHKGPDRSTPSPPKGRYPHLSTEEKATSLPDERSLGRATCTLRSRYKCPQLASPTRRRKRGYHIEGSRRNLHVSGGKASRATHFPDLPFIPESISPSLIVITSSVFRVLGEHVLEGMYSITIYYLLRQSVVHRNIAVQGLEKKLPLCVHFTYATI